MNRLLRFAFLSLTCVLLGSSAAHAQASRTWVSGVGDDANPCSRTAPCKTFAGAISKTAAHGEISVLDPGGFGAITITKSITISGDGNLAGILAAGTNGVIINAASTDAVILRNISLRGFNTGLNGIRLLAGGSLIVENVTISGFTGAGISVELTNGGAVVVEDTTISNAATGIKVNGGVRVDVALKNVSIRDTATGVQNVFGFTNITDSLISQNATNGILCEGGSVNVENSSLTGNGTAVIAMPAGTIRMANSAFYNNLTAFGCGGGVLASAGNNRKGANMGGTGGACAPTQTITLQ